MPNLTPSPARFGLCVSILLSFFSPAVFSQDTPAFDGRPWNVSTGNASVYFIHASPIGAAPRENVLEAPPDAASLKRMKAAGLVAYEDYVAWGAVERSAGTWSLGSA